MPNTFAYVVLIGWPLVAIYLFSTKSLEKAIIWSVVSSFLFLPSSFAIDFVGLPPLDKEAVSNLTMLAIILVIARKRFRFIPQNSLAKLLLLFMIVGAFLTSINNQDAIWNGARLLPGLKPYDAVSAIGQQILIVLPFLVGWQYLATEKAHREILQVFLITGLAYSLLALFEVRMSPQLHTWIYGYFPHDFIQTARWGGWRPVVFLNHGLWLAFFIFTATFAAATLWRDSKSSISNSDQISFRSKRRPLLLLATGYLGSVLLICKSLGSIIFAVFSIPLVLVAKRQTQVRVAVLLALISVTYPLLRGADLVPVNTIVQIAKSISVERAQSLSTRIRNEDRLLAHAEERPMFGWGSWGRNRVYEEESGKDISVTDGYWIISIGTFGWAGYLSSIGLLAFPILAVWRKSRKLGAEKLPLVTCGLCLLLGINLMELVPNATLPPWTWLIAGALLGFAESSETDDINQPVKNSKHTVGQRDFSK